MDHAIHALVVLGVDDAPASHYEDMSETQRLDFLETVWARVRVWNCNYEQAALHVKNLAAAVEWTKRGRVIPEVE